MDHRALPIGESNSNANMNIEDEHIEDESHSSNEAPLSFDELLASDPNLVCDGIVEAILGDSPQYHIA